MTPRSLPGTRVDALVAALDVDLNAPICYACLSFVSFAIDGGDRADKIFLEPKVGGRFYERFSDGEEFEVGRVIACEPPTRIIFTWKDPNWKAPTEVEVRFSPAGNGTRVDIEHRGFDAAGVQPEEAAGWADGWKTVLATYVEAANGPNRGR